MFCLQGPSRAGPPRRVLPRVHPVAARVHGAPRHPRAAQNPARGTVPDDQVTRLGRVRAVHTQGASTANAEIGPQRRRAPSHDRRADPRVRDAHAAGQAPRVLTRGPARGKDARHRVHTRVPIPRVDHRGW